MRVDISWGVLLWVPVLLVEGLGLDHETLSKYSNISSGRRIVNGVPANPEDFQYIVHLHTDGPHASGNVIDGRWILTVAHALVNDVCPNLKIFPSSWQPGDTTTMTAVKCYIHDKYTPAENAYDIGLVKSSDNLLNSGQCQTIPLPEPGTQYAPGTRGTIAGWGLKTDGTLSDRLLTGDVMVESWETCNEAFAHSPPECGGKPECTALNVPRRMVCLRGDGPNPKNICAGDSGGPLTIDGTLVGVASVGFFSDKCIVGTVTMFTSIVDYLPWIYSFTHPEKNTNGFPVAPEFDKTIPA
ncbi:trypsin-7 [Neodiprion lecontei]|uniref:Trypsin-7 n=1 Tax=Neodiprion lecontei TaxID=441921 RepID=A0A6J0C8U0_NEOLC|nr:trypsin-7 [Neodiprion lecontei]